VDATNEGRAKSPGLILWVEARYAGDLANAMIGAGLDVAAAA